MDNGNQTVIVSVVYSVLKRSYLKLNTAIIQIVPY